MPRAIEFLIEAVKATGLTFEDFKSIDDHGVDKNWPGFTHYKDTSAFYERHSEMI